MNPISPEIDEKLVMDDLSVYEVEVGELDPFELEDLNEKPDENEQAANNLPDAPFGMETRKLKKRKSYNSENSASTDSSDSDDQRSYSLPGNSSDEDVTLAGADLDKTEVNFTNKPVPGYQEIAGDLFISRKQRKKGYAYALAHCISADATMGAGFAVTFCNHFPDLRRRVENELNVKAFLAVIHYEEDNC